MKDYVIRGRIEGFDIAFGFCICTEVANEAVLRHQLDPVAAHLLGRALTAGVLCSTTLGTNERVNLRWKYEGHLRTLIVDAGDDQTIRGFVSPREMASDNEKRDDIYGDGGQITVVTSRGSKVLNSGSTDAHLLHVTRDLAHHYSISAQVETGLTAMIGFCRDTEHPVDLAQGLMIQALPDCDLERFDRIRQRLDSEACRALLQRKTEADGHFESVINAILEGEGAPSDLVIEPGQTPTFSCTCSKEKMGPVLRTIPYNDRMDMARAKDDVAINCQFCSRRFSFSIDDCIKAWNNKPFDD